MLAAWGNEMSDAQFRALVWARPECQRLRTVLMRSEFGGPGDRGFGDDPGGVAAETRLAHDVAGLCARLDVDVSRVRRADVEQAFIDEGRLSKDPLWRPQFADRMIDAVYAAYRRQPVWLTVEQRAAADMIVARDLGSASMIQRTLRISFRRAMELMGELEAAGIVGPAHGSHARDVLVTANELANYSTAEVSL